MANTVCCTAVDPTTEAHTLLRVLMSYENKKSNIKYLKMHEMNPNEERRKSELQNTLPLRYPFTAQKLRKKKTTLSAFTLDGIWAARPSSSAGLEPT
ncbi:hypothetical protein AVEN_77219-1 [Araneus ventricosus]|uniref:Uncharacterized protein n=1 Tax=Araneus ventricosus TaxID=182803 RepID=A0A4Y2SE95_ARAVE|nr:hypothetical protein AVEN_77219-1 [Araneus ventricosus]